MVRIKEKMTLDIKNWPNLDKKVENKNKSKKRWERWLRTTTESRQKQTKKTKNTEGISDKKRE